MRVAGHVDKHGALHQVPVHFVTEQDERPVTSNRDIARHLPPVYEKPFDGGVGLCPCRDDAEQQERDGTNQAQLYSLPDAAAVEVQPIFAERHDFGRHQAAGAIKNCDADTCKL